MGATRLGFLATKRAVRALIAVNLVLSLAFLAASADAYEPDVHPALATDGGGDAAVSPRPNITVITTQDPGQGIFHQAELVAFHPNGSVLYYNRTFHTYWDVDPVPNTTATVVYAASHRLHGDSCAGIEFCYRNYVVKTNLSTGDSTVLYTRIRQDRWHDVDRLDSARVLIAGIGRDQVSLVDHETGIVEWEWNAQHDYDTANGGPYPADWTHLNDVDRLPDGRVMASLKNQKQVVFIDPETGLVANWTLGREDDPAILNGVHNPDYIPRDRGGPAVVAADSLNNRVVEYHRTGTGWTQTWTWTDAEMAWPRDADRLPNGHTLIADSNGNRVIEVDRAGTVVWRINVNTPYEVERFETGAGSTGGESARRLGLANRTAETAGGVSADGPPPGGDAAVTDRAIVKRHVPSFYFNSALFILPPWVNLAEILVALWGIGLLLAWPLLELRWQLANRTIRLQLPVVLDRD